jgi:hypothetical protein
MYVSPALACICHGRWGVGAVAPDSSGSVRQLGTMVGGIGVLQFYVLFIAHVYCMRLKSPSGAPPPRLNTISRLQALRVQSTVFWVTASGEGTFFALYKLPVEVKQQMYICIFAEQPREIRPPDTTMQDRIVLDCKRGYRK